MEQILNATVKTDRGPRLAERIGDPPAARAFERLRGGSAR